MSVKSILSDIGHGLKVFFEGAVHVAQVAEPIVDLATAALPGVPALYNATVNFAAQAEVYALAVGVQTGSGQQKLALVVGQITPIFLQYAKDNGINVNGDTITNWVNAVVATLNSIPPANPATFLPAPNPAPPAVAGASTATQSS